MANHIWREKSNYYILWDEVQIIYREYHLKMREIIEVAKC